MDSINQWLELMVNLSVVGGVIVLVLEIRQNTKVSRVQVSTDLVKLAHEHSNWKRDREFSGVVTRALEDHDSLDAIERMQFNTYAFQLFNLWEFSYDCHRNNALPEMAWKSYDDSFCVRFKYPAWCMSWENNRISFGPEFQKHVDSVVSNLKERSEPFDNE